MKPRVVILSAFATPLRSGAEACAEEVGLAMLERYDVILVTARLLRSSSKRDLLHGRLPVRRIGLGLPIDKWLFPLLAPFVVRALRPRLVHAVLESYAGLAMILTSWTYPHAKRLLTCQSTNTSLLLGWMHRSADRVTAISSVLVRRALGYGRKDVLRIPNGVHVGMYAHERARERRVPGCILFVGRLERMKGVDVLIDAFRLLASEFPHAHLRIVGSGSLRRTLERRAADLAATGRITFAGYLPADAVAAEFARAPIFCALSRSEALGNVFLEAQAAGCAVVASRTGGIPDIVVEGQTGLLIPPNHPQEAADALRLLLRKNDLTDRLGKAGADHARKFDWSRITAEYGRVYDELCS
ncbi:MAG: group 1 glycosyl transferase [Candidatus Peregrinibacteria bacterium Gr01-1014_25]|nr:MAG: group 1 glycosyl transferase [Candidatus Peregrinibacteria bacterium Gr01-1014_25]